MLTHVILGTCAGDSGFEARAGTRFRRRRRRRCRISRSRPYKGELQKNTLRSRQHKGAKSGAAPSPAPVVLRSQQHKGAKSGASPSPAPVVLRSRQHKGAKSGASPSPAPVVLRSRQHKGAKSGASPATTGTGTTAPTSNKNGNANHIATLYIFKLPIVRFSGCYVIVI